MQDQNIKNLLNQSPQLNINQSANSGTDIGNLNNNNFSNGGDNNINSKKNIIILIGSALLIIIIITVSYFAFFNKKAVISAEVDTSVKFPDLGKNGAGQYYDPNAIDTSANKDIDTIQEADRSELIHIWPKPVVTFIGVKEKMLEIVSEVKSSDATINATTIEPSIIQKTVSKQVDAIYFVDKAIGNIYRSVSPDYKSERISKTNIANISQARFSFDASYLALIKDNNLIIDSLSKNIDSSFNEANVIDKNVLNIYNNNFDSRFLYTKSENRGLGLYVYNTKSGETQKVSYLAISNVRLDWRDKDSIYIFTSPTDKIKQSVLKLSLVTGKISSHIYNEGNNIFLGQDIIYTQEGNLKYKNLSGKVIDLETATFADKCIFAGELKVICSVPNQLYSTNIDDWYMGAQRFADSLYYFDISFGERKNFFDQSLVSGESIDSYNMSMSDDKLLMQNKNDDSLWLLDISGAI